MNIVRGLAIFPASMLAWIFTAVIGSTALDLSVLVFCPVESREGADCYIGWWHNVEEIIITFFVGLSAVAAISLGTWVAPFNKLYFAKIIYALGMLIAFVMVYSTPELWLACVSCLLSGCATVWVIRNKTAGSTKCS